MFSRPQLSLDVDTARLLTELTAASQLSESPDSLLASLADIQAHSNPKPGILVHFQVRSFSRIILATLGS